VYSGRAGLGRLLRVDYGRQDLHIHFDKTDGILSNIRIVGDHHHYRLTDKSHFAHCQGVVYWNLHPWSGPTARNRPHLAEQIGPGQHRHYTWVVFCRLDIEALDTGMRIGAAKEDGM
jgi:hypothetical protein